jgi:hypothetical protein
MGRKGVRRTLGAVTVLIVVLGISACGGSGEPPAKADPAELVFTGAPSNKAVKLLVSEPGEWQITSISVTGTDFIKFIKQDQCANHVFVVTNATKECEEVVQFFGVFEAGLRANLRVVGTGINGSVGNLTLNIPIKS